MADFKSETFFYLYNNFLSGKKPKGSANPAVLHKAGWLSESMQYSLSWAAIWPVTAQQHSQSILRQKAENINLVFPDVNAGMSYTAKMQPNIW